MRDTREVPTYSGVVRGTGLLYKHAGKYTDRKRFAGFSCSAVSLGD